MKGRADDGKFDQIGTQLLQKLVGICFEQLKTDGREIFMEGGNPFGQQAAANRGYHTQPQRAGQSVAVIQQFFPGHLRQLQHGDSPFIEKLPGFRKLDFP